MIKLRPLGIRDLDTLNELDDHTVGGGWVKPLQLGGHSRSHHSATLKKLVRHGMAEVRNPSILRKVGMSKYHRSGCWYRISAVGRKRLMEYLKGLD